MRQYILYSGTFHLAATALVFFFLRPAMNMAAKTSIYSVDFVGAQADKAMQAPAAAPASTPAPATVPPAQPAPAPATPATDDINLRRRNWKTKKNFPAALPAPSVLKASAPPAPSMAAYSAKLTAQAQPAATAAAQQAGGEGMSTDFPNFPYPWYITRVRAALWNEWSTRMPHSGAMSAVITFRISRTGQLGALSVEKSSYNKLFDFAALSSVEQSAPFPPLPADYRQENLTVHVEFKSDQ